jgi:hypothetical protein
MARRSAILSLSVLTVLAGLKLSAPVAAAIGTIPEHDCAGAPPDAVTTLPAPLSKWGEVMCTPYGHMLASHASWMWLMPDFDTVLIPAQISDKTPEELGNKIYFTKIDVMRVKGAEFEQAYKAFHQDFDDTEVKPDAYRVDLTTVEGKSLRMYFFDYDTYAWGISCPDGKCATDTRFMILDRNTPPKPREPSI